MYKRIVWGFLGATLFALSTAAVSAAANTSLVAEPYQVETPEDCRECHQITYAHWAESAHANAISDNEFQLLWQEQGNDPACLSCHSTGFDPLSGTADIANIACSTCHYPGPESHPDQIMPTEISSRMCGTCHIETIAEFEMSAHQENELACVTCHDAHGTTLKTENSTELCASCHRENVHFFSYTPHAEAGLECVDCHLMVEETATLGEGHATRRHTFSVSLDTCAECHGDQMHFPDPQNQAVKPDQEVHSGFVPGADDIHASNPISFILLATIIGMGAGLILSPWLEGWYDRFTSMSDWS